MRAGAPAISSLSMARKPSERGAGRVGEGALDGGLVAAMASDAIDMVRRDLAPAMSSYARRLPSRRHPRRRRGAAAPCRRARSRSCGPAAQLLLRAVADAPRRHVEHAVQADRVERVEDEAQVGEQVLDLAAFVEARAADEPVGQALGDEALFQGAGLGVGAVHDGDVAEVQAGLLALQALDLAGRRSRPPPPGCRPRRPRWGRRRPSRSRAPSLCAACWPR